MLAQKHTAMRFNGQDVALSDMVSGRGDRLMVRLDDLRWSKDDLLDHQV